MFVYVGNRTQIKIKLGTSNQTYFERIKLIPQDTIYLVAIILCEHYVQPKTFRLNIMHSLKHQSLVFHLNSQVGQLGTL